MENVTENKNTVVDSQNVELNKFYFSTGNSIKGLSYKVIKKNKTTCWVELYEYNEPSGIIYKDVSYDILKPAK